jgi:hypothetical protein
MKNQKWNQKSALGVISLVMMSSACSPHLKEPVEDLASFRENAKTEVKKGPVKPQVVQETIVVEKPKVVIQEQAKIDSSLLVLDNQKVFTFTEGQAGTYKISVRHLAPNLTSQLAARNLPKGMTLKKISTQANQDDYEITWTPGLYFVASQRIYEKHDIELEVTSLSQDPVLKNLKVIEPATILVTRQNVAPSNLEVRGLPESVQMSKLIKFSIVSKVPGYDDKSQEKPTLVISPDPLIYTPGVEKEWDASRHVTFSSNYASKYLGNELWQFDLVMDTQNIAPQAKELPAKMRMLAKVYSPNGLSTASSIVRFTLVGEQK